MMLTDREWLRFVSFGLFAGAVLGTVYTGALVVSGRPPVHAMTGSVAGGGVLAITVHVVIRHLLDRASEPPAEDTTPGVDP